MPADAIAGSPRACQSWRSTSEPVIRPSWTSDSAASASPPPPQLKDNTQLHWGGALAEKVTIIIITVMVEEKNPFFYHRSVYAVQWTCLIFIYFSDWVPVFSKRPCREGSRRWRMWSQQLWFNTFISFFVQFPGKSSCSLWIKHSMFSDWTTEELQWLITVTLSD